MTSELQSAPPEMRIVLVANSLASNSLGRVYCLWMLAKHLRWHVRVIAMKSEPLWPPMSNTEFAKDCTVLSPEEISSGLWSRDIDLIIACKVLPSSFGFAKRESERSGIPLLVDIDDPDIENLIFGRGRVRTIARFALKSRRTVRHLAMRRAARRTPNIVSNPALQQYYGGPVVPHVRPDPGFGAPHRSTSPKVAFVGTARDHKGINEIRFAVKQLQALGFTLVVTDTPPDDEEPWEEWVGQTSFERGLFIVSEADVIVLPSRPSVMSRGQLPAKLIDAMLAGRAIVVSDLPPLVWALDSCGVTFPSTETSQLTEALRPLTDPRLRDHLGREARSTALTKFTVTACADDFAKACLRAVQCSR